MTSKRLACKIEIAIDTVPPRAGELILEVHMRSRFCLIGVPAYVIAVLLLASVPFVGQVKSSPAKGVPATKNWTVPRTSDGKPDLQGVWNSATLTPMERPKQFANKPIASTGLT